MTPDQLNSLLSRMGCIRVGQTLYCPCPNHQPDETDPERFKLMVSPGGAYAAICYCPVCHVPKPSTDEDRQHNRTVSRQIWQAVGADLDLIYSRMDAGEIRRLWSQIKLGGISIEPSKDSGRASDQMVHMAYDSLLQSLDLKVKDRGLLRKGGFDPDHCYEIGYRSAAGPVASILDVEGVPGLVNGEWKLRSDYKSILIPCRTPDGLLAAIKMRLIGRSKSKMRTLSSADWKGPKGRAIIHWPIGSKPNHSQLLWACEGEKKADLLYARQGGSVCGIPGVNLANRLVSLCIEQGIRSVVLAMDTDEHGRKAESRLGRELTEKGVVVQVAKWEGHKGIDDALAAGSEIRVEIWEDGGGEVFNNSPPTKSPLATTSTKLKDHEVLPFIRQNSPVLRSNLNCFQLLVSEYIRRGIIQMEKTPDGQLLRAT